MTIIKIEILGRSTKFADKNDLCRKILFNDVSARPEIQGDSRFFSSTRRTKFANLLKFILCWIWIGLKPCVIIIESFVCGQCEFSHAVRRTSSAVGGERHVHRRSASERSMRPSGRPPGSRYPLEREKPASQARANHETSHGRPLQCGFFGINKYENRAPI
jgi:hypothetical protein